MVVLSVAPRHSVQANGHGRFEQRLRWLPRRAAIVWARYELGLTHCTLAENLLIMPLSLALAEPHDRAQGRSVLLQSLRGLFKNPMIIGMSAGIIFSALDVHLPAFATTAIGLVASAASPLHCS